MRKLLVLCIAGLLFTTGCNKHNSNERDFQNTYDSFVDSILDNNGVQSNDIPFSHSLHVVKESSGEYRYEITIDQPRVAMYNIQMMVVDKNSSGEYPFIGLLSDEDQYNMVPFQENKEKNFVKGIILGGVSSNPKFSLHIQVSWKDFGQVNTHTAFFTYTYDYEKDHVDENTTVKTPEDSAKENEE